MATVTFTGPRASMTFAGLTFRNGEARPVPDSAVEGLRAHPWFAVEADDAPETDDAPEPRRRGRPRKVAE
jgi:hypothetical protein